MFGASATSRRGWRGSLFSSKPIKRVLHEPTPATPCGGGESPAGAEPVSTDRGSLPRLPQAPSRAVAGTGREGPRAGGARGPPGVGGDRGARKPGKKPCSESRRHPGALAGTRTRPSSGCSAAPGAGVSRAGRAGLPGARRPALYRRAARGHGPHPAGTGLRWGAAPEPGGAERAVAARRPFSCSPPGTLAARP